jgi:branched-chain amino acid aminotransferase
MTICVNVDGRLGSAEERSLSPLDQGFLFGASVYETIRTYEGVPFLPSRHFKRLRESAEALGIEIDTSDDELRRRLYETLDSAGNEESSIRIVVTAGVGSMDYRAGSSTTPTIVIIVRPLPPHAESLYREGAVASFVPIMRAAPGGVNPRIKSSNLISNLMALRAAHAKGAYEALMLNPRGEVCEGSMSNVFFVKDDTIVTPPLSSGILEGITRELIVSIGHESGFEVEERAFVPDELLQADEVFITASSRQIVPIVRVDDTQIADGRPGDVTRKLMSLYTEKVRELIRADESKREGAP